MKIIKINESQSKRLFEAYKEGFSFDELTMIADSAFADEDNSVPQMAYCRKWLGQPTSMGSSRCVFTLSDNIILKLAYGGYYKAGIDQNRAEYELYEKTKSPLLPIIYDCDKNFTYLVCENVIPAVEEDFEKILGIPFYNEYKQHSLPKKNPYSMNGGDAKVGYNKYFTNLKQYGARSIVTIYSIMAYMEANYVLHEEYFDKDIELAIIRSKWLTELRNLIKQTEIGDFCKFDNFGMVNRNGTPTLVILDSGMNMDVWKKHYHI